MHSDPHDDAALAEATDQPAERIELTERDHKILAFEHTWWKHAGAKEEAIRHDFEISPARYYQLVDALIDDPLALQADPMLVKRLQRIREARVARRTARSELRRHPAR